MIGWMIFWAIMFIAWVILTLTTSNIAVLLIGILYVGVSLYHFIQEFYDWRNSRRKPHGR
jgi:hypothetical protein